MKTGTAREKRVDKIRRGLGIVFVLGVLATGAQSQEQVTGPASQVAPPAPGPGRILGRVLQAPLDEPVGDVAVALYSLQPDGTPGLIGSSTDKEGRFLFSGVSNTPAVVYLLGASRSEVPFARRISFLEGQTEIQADLRLQEISADGSAIELATTTYRLDWVGGKLFVLIAHQLHNPTEQVVHIEAKNRNQKAPVFSMQLPAGVDQFMAAPSGFEDSLVREGDAVSYWGPVYPGEQEIRYGVLLETPLAKAPAEGSSILELNFPTGRSKPKIEVLIPQNQGAPTSGDLEPTGAVVPVEGQQYTQFVSKSRNEEGQLRFSLPLPQTSSDKTGIRIERADYWIEQDDTAMRVRVDLQIESEGKTVRFAPTGEPLLHIDLPAGAEVQDLSANAFALGVTSDPVDGLDLRGPIPAGPSTLSFRFQAPMTGAGGGRTSPSMLTGAGTQSGTNKLDLLRRHAAKAAAKRAPKKAPAKAPAKAPVKTPVQEDGSVELELAFNLPVSLLNVLLADNGLIIESDRLHSKRPFKEGTRFYQYREAYQLKPNEKVSLRIQRIVDRGAPREIVTAGILIAAALAFVFLVFPLRGGRADSHESIEGDPSDYARERASLYESIEDIEHDRDVGKLEDGEFQKMRQELRAEAIQLMRQEKGQSAETEKKKMTFCPQCGTPLKDHWRFCADCGAPVAKESEA